MFFAFLAGLLLGCFGMAFALGLAGGPEEEKEDCFLDRLEKGDENAAAVARHYLTHAYLEEQKKAQTEIDAAEIRRILREDRGKRGGSEW